MARDKRMLIYEAALSLIDEKHNISSIKVSEIAERANIGKGTVYEYFKSKEQLIAQAIVSTVKEEISSLKGIMKAEHSFKEGYFMILDNIGRIMDKNMTLFRYMVMNECNFSMQKAVKEVIREQFEDIRSIYVNVFENLLDKGMEEGIIKEKPAQYVLYMAVNNSTMCLHMHKQKLKEFQDITEEEMIQKSYEMFVKLLN